MPDDANQDSGGVGPRPGKRDFLVAIRMHGIDLEGQGAGDVLGFDPGHGGQTNDDVAARQEHRGRQVLLAIAYEKLAEFPAPVGGRAMVEIGNDGAGHDGYAVGTGSDQSHLKIRILDSNADGCAEGQVLGPVLAVGLRWNGLDY